ncbi:MAG TPA: dethiobiotin synthase [Thermodesulfobacteriota bacterium]|nr:dethiobiotin synthase [Thermodesulfobacteriota bacterium]
MPPLEDGVFVTGTDTGVGKTVIAAALAWSLSCAGRSVAVMKPVQTGMSLPGTADIGFVENVLGTKYDPSDVCIYRLSEPLSPLAASEISGIKIDTGKIIEAYRRLRSAHDVVIVEGAGGLLVPITDNYLMSDLASDLGLPLLIVTRPGLGTLNHTSLTVESARKRGIDVLGVVINRFPASPGLAERTNPEQITRMTGAPIVGVFPDDPTISVEGGEAGDIRELARAALAPALGGLFDLREFLGRLR